MKKLALVFVVLLFNILAVNAMDYITKGVEPGKWTMDYDAAIKYAKSKELPIMIAFSGSDWCKWCKLMDKEVFSKDEWTKYAKDNIVTILIDFPSDKSKVPEEYIKRNRALQDRFQVTGFPTFIILSEDGKTLLGELSAFEDPTPEKFLAKLRPFLVYTKKNVDAYLKTLPRKKRSEYSRIIKELRKSEDELVEYKDTIKDAKEKIVELQKNIKKLEGKAREFRVSMLPEKEQNEFHAIKDDLTKRMKELDDWIAGNPEQNKNNYKKYQEMVQKIQELSLKISKY